MAPSLALTYSSRGRDGLAGVGWALSGLSEIRRIPKTLAADAATDGIDFDGLDTFGLDGARLVRLGPTPDGGVEYRTEPDQLAKVVAYTGPGGPAVNPERFRVYTKAGLIRDYQPLFATRRSVDRDTGEASTMLVAATWVLREERDRTGNFVRYHYETENDSFYPYPFRYRPTIIEYTLSDGGLPATKWVDIQYESRPDPRVNYHAGIRTDHDRRILELRVFAPNPVATERVWTYHLDYSTSPDTERGLLASVRKCDAAERCNWSKSFAYGTKGPPVVNFQTLEYSEPSFDPYYFGDTANGFLYGDHPTDLRPVVFDADGDGRDDVLFRTEDVGDDVGGAFGIVLRTSTFGPLATRYLTNLSGSNFGEEVLAKSRPVDIDMDGKSELLAGLRHPTGDGTYEFLYRMMRWNSATAQFDGVGLADIVVWNNEVVSIGPPAPYLLDFDGDGILDLLEHEVSVGQGGLIVQDWQLHPGQIGGFAPSQSTGVSALCDEYTPGFHFLATDLDADGRGDFILPKEIQGACKTLHGLNVDDAGVLQTTDAWQLSDDDGEELVLIDLNGDGLRDVFYPAGTLGKPHGTTVRWNTGAGLLLPAAVQVSSVLDSEEYVYDEALDEYHFIADRGTRVADVDRDGREDIIAFRSSVGGVIVLLSRHDGFQELVFTLDPGELHPTLGWATTQLGDFNGDGQIDLVSLNEDGTIKVHLGEWGPTDLLIEVRDEPIPTPRESFEYGLGGSASSGVSACVFPAYCPKHASVVVLEHRVDQGLNVGVARRTRYTYEDPVFDLQGRGFLGYSRVTAFDPDVPSMRLTEMDLRTSVTHPTTHLRHYPGSAGPSVTTEVTALLSTPTLGAPISGTFPVRVTQSKQVYDVRWLHGGATYLVEPTRWTSKMWEDSAAVWGNALQGYDESTVPLTSQSGSYTYDDFGNTLTSYRLSVTGLYESLARTVDNDTASWLIGLVRTSAETSQEPGQAPETREMAFEYDALGRLHRRITEPNQPTLRHVIQHTRNSLGNLHYTTEFGWGAPLRHVTFSWDSDGTFIQSATNELGHVTASLTHPAHGRPLWEQEPNGNVTTYVRDGFGRVRDVYPAVGAPTHIDYAESFWETPQHPTGVAVITTDDAGGQGIIHHDELGRARVQASLGFDGTPIATEMHYDRFGNLVRETNPGLLAPGSAESVYAFDTLGRMTTSIAPDSATTTWVHSFLETHVWNPRGNESYVVRDLDGRVIRSVAKHAASPGQAPADLVTLFTYGAFGTLRSVTDSMGNLTTREYDTLGRVTSMVDPDAGTSSFLYDGFGAPVWAQHAAGAPIVWSRDALGRATSRQDQDGLTKYTWDTAPNGRGKLAKTTSPDGTTVSQTYDSRSLPDTTTWTVSGATYAVTTSYDPYGRLARTSYPEAPGKKFVIERQYNAYGYLESLTDVASEPAVPHWTALAANAFGSLTQVRYGSQLEEYRSHNPWTNRLELKQAPQANLGLQYFYDENGNVEERNDFLAGRPEVFTYDDLDRLESWSLWTNTTEYTYDAIANLKTVRQNGQLIASYVHGAQGKPHALQGNLLDLFGLYQYDGKGRQLSGQGRTTAFTGATAVQPRQGRHGVDGVEPRARPSP